MLSPGLLTAGVQGWGGSHPETSQAPPVSSGSQLAGFQTQQQGRQDRRVSTPAQALGAHLQAPQAP